MGLFSEKIRNDYTSVLESESSFAYLDRSARQECERIRHTTEAWFTDYPNEAKADVSGRFRSKNDMQHLSAFFELYMHRILKQIGYDISVHSALSSAQKRPDFLVKDRESSFAMEVTCVSHQDQNAATSAMHQAILVDHLNRNVARNRKIANRFWLDVEVNGEKNKEFNLKYFAGSIIMWLECLDRSKVPEIQSVRSFDDLPELVRSQNGFRVIVRAISKSKHQREDLTLPTVGLQSGGGGWSRAEEILDNELKYRAKKYGAFDKSFVICLNVVDHYVLQHSCELSLIGNHEYRGIPSDNFFFRPDRHTRVSAVMFVCRLSPWTIHSQRPVLYHNPWAQFRLEGPICQLDQAYVINNLFNYQLGLNPSDILGPNA